MHDKQLKRHYVTTKEYYEKVQYYNKKLEKIWQSLKLRDERLRQWQK